MVREWVVVLQITKRDLEDFQEITQHVIVKLLHMIHLIIESMEQAEIHIFH